MTRRWRNPVPCRVLPVGSPMISAGTSLLGCHPGCMSLTPPNSPGPAQSLRRSGRGLPTAWLVHGRVLQTAPGSCSLSWQSWGPTGAGRSMASLSHPSFPASTSAPKAPPDSGGVQEGAGSVPKGTTELPRTLGPFLNWLFSLLSFSSPHSRAQVTLWTTFWPDLLESHSVCTSLAAPAATGRRLRQSSYWLPLLPISVTSSSSAPEPWITAEASAALRLGCFSLHPLGCAGKTRQQ